MVARAFIESSSEVIPPGITREGFSAKDGFLVGKNSTLPVTGLFIYTHISSQ